MKSKQIIYFAIGVFTLILGIYFSFIHYNPADTFGTVHEFSYGCIVQSQEFMETYDSAFERGMCTHNGILSLIVFSIIGSGIFLIIKSLKR